MTCTATFRDPTYAGIDDLVDSRQIALFITLPITYRLPEHWPAPEAEEDD